MERLERRIVAEYRQDAKGHKERLQQNLRVRAMLDQLQDKARGLVRSQPCRLGSEPLKPRPGRGSRFAQQPWPPERDPDPFIVATPQG